MRVWLLACTLLLAGPAGAADSDSAPAAAPAPTLEPAPAGGATGEEPAPTAEDPMITRFRAIVTRYYEGIAATPTDAEMRDGIDAIRFMVLDGVSIPRIDAAVADAIRLHTPGRRVPFPIAVPLRVKAEPAVSPDRGEPQETLLEPATDTIADEPTREVLGETATAGDDRWAARAEQLRERRNRLRLYVQWKDRTRGKRALVSIGAPLLAGGWVAGFAVTAAYANAQYVDPGSGWLGAIPIGGPIAFNVVMGGGDPALWAFTLLQGAGAALLIAGAAQKVDWPYDRDPTALRLGTKRDGGAALTLRAAPAGAGGVLVGIF